MDNGQIINGSNQENAAYPSGLCAERTALFYANINQTFENLADTSVSLNKITDSLSQANLKGVISEFETTALSLNTLLNSINNGEGSLL